LTTAPITFVFGVRNIEDSFYDTEIMGLSEWFSDFQSVSYFSRALDLSTKIQKPKAKNLSGYVTDWITTENIAPYAEFYICGSPAMVKSAREKLEALGVESERVFWEQF
jgi:ferredoxin-NADP reductase